MDLFTGIGGITVALSEWVRPVAYCEIDKYCQSVLLNRMSEGSLPTAPIWSDIRTLDPQAIPHEIDIIYGGFPCQDISTQGAGAGLGGPKSSLFFEMVRIIKEIQPRFLFLENVSAIRTKGLFTVVKTLSDLGYDCRWTTVSAAEVGAPHIRKRWFLLAYAHSERLEGYIWEKPSDPEPPEYLRKAWFETEPAVARVANGVPARVDRVKALGNAVVPLQAREAFKRLMGLE